MHEEVEYVRRGIASALSRVGPDAVPGLVEALTNSSASVRQAAILALGQMGPEAKRAAPALTEALHDKEGFVRSAAAVAIKRVDPLGAYGREKGPASGRHTWHLAVGAMQVVQQRRNHLAKASEVIHLVHHAGPPGDWVSSFFTHSAVDEFAAVFAPPPASNPARHGSPADAR